MKLLNININKYDVVQFYPIVEKWSHFSSFHAEPLSTVMSDDSKWYLQMSIMYLTPLAVWKQLWLAKVCVTGEIFNTVVSGMLVTC